MKKCFRDCFKWQKLICQNEAAGLRALSRCMDGRISKFSEEEPKWKREEASKTCPLTQPNINVVFTVNITCYGCDELLLSICLRAPFHFGAIKKEHIFICTNSTRKKLFNDPLSQTE